MKKLPFVLLFNMAIVCNAQIKNDLLLQQILSNSKDSLLHAVLSNPGTYQYQIIYTQINRDKNNRPVLKNYYLNVDHNRYFYPASVVKMPLAFLSLEKLHELNKYGVDASTSMLTDSAGYQQTIAHADSSAETGLPSIAQYIRKAFLISDNDAYNRMYEFVGQQQINRRLHGMGYTDTRITRRFKRLSLEEQAHTNPIRFVDANNKLLYAQPAAYNTDGFDFSHKILMGNAHYNSNDSLIHEPLDFTTNNNLPLEDMQQILQSVIFPSSVPEKQRFHLSQDDLDFLYRYLSQFPSETNYPKYDTSVYYDSYVKFFFRNASHRMPESVRVFNKVGWSYGSLTDVSYIVDFNNKTEFMLAANIYVNSNGILNDNTYDYETIGAPFFYELGQTIYQYELNRKKQYLPDLSAFKMDYHLRKEDNRPAIKDADN